MSNKSSISGKYLCRIFSPQGNKKGAKMNDDVLLLILRELKALRLEVIAMRKDKHGKPCQTEKEPKKDLTLERLKSFNINIGRN